MTEEQKAQIDSMSHVELCQHWRFAPSGDELLSGDTGDYFRKVLFEDHKGFTPEISKLIGW
jgi:hypothetical protein